MRVLPKVNMPCCGVFAVVLAMEGTRFEDKTFEEVFDLAKVVLERTGAWRGRTKVKEVLGLLQLLGVAFQRAYPSQAAITPETLAMRVCCNSTSIHHMVRVTGHWVTLAAGKIYDQHHPGGIGADRHPARRKKVKDILRITKSH